LKKLLLNVSEIVVKYGPFIALQGISIDVQEKEVVALIGPNGAGKSTLLKTIIGLLMPTSGTIEYKGSRIDGMKPFQTVSKGISLSSEGHRILPYMSVEENLLMGAYTLRDKASIEAGLKRAYNLFPILLDRKRQLAGTLSGGEQQMLAIGSALASNPQLLLLDEPSLGLAPKIYSEIIRTLKKIREQGVTILISEQNAKVAMDIADRVYILQSGRLFIHDVPANLKNNPEVAEIYLAVY
jgi:branched-chain amino acid transport system ATP-binding protein